MRSEPLLKKNLKELKKEVRNVLCHCVHCSIDTLCDLDVLGMANLVLLRILSQPIDVDFHVHYLNSVPHFLLFFIL